ncbi:MAG: response regulator transcription factor, partial [Hyphomicrobiaceae bacterium]
QKILAETPEAMPVIFTSAIKDIEITVRTMKAGAVDFLIKPVQPPALLAAVSRALALEEVLFGDRMSHFIAQRRVCKLTPREREVLSRVIAGNLNKEIAADLGTAEKTVKLHRSRMMKKLSIRSVPDLVRLAQHAGIEPHSCVSDYSRYNWPGADA